MITQIAVTKYGYLKSIATLLLVQASKEVTLCINNRKTVFSNNEMSLNGRGIITGLLFVDNAYT